ncbi:unnamed protein product [Symbiodinium natans]|uniref:Uncharacterized protein n=1 Tax=Symbiodinium natans TaxID=878477 RepID=A0A812PVF8_9DINO|nr:unnamed protein product [Symbiodinium natans]
MGAALQRIEELHASAPFKLPPLQKPDGYDQRISACRELGMTFHVSMSKDVFSSQGLSREGFHELLREKITEADLRLQDLNLKLKEPEEAEARKEPTFHRLRRLFSNIFGESLWLAERADLTEKRQQWQAWINKTSVADTYSKVCVEDSSVYLSSTGGTSLQVKFVGFKMNEDDKVQFVQADFSGGCQIQVAPKNWDADGGIKALKAISTLGIWNLVNHFEDTAQKSREDEALAQLMSPGIMRYYVVAHSENTFLQEGISWKCDSNGLLKILAAVA